MRAETNRYWIRAVAVSVVAFVLGVAIYILVGVAVAHGMSRANAAWHQVTIAPVECDCVIKFVPNQPLLGSGTVIDPYITYNSQVPLVVGFTGVGLVTIEDQNGNILYTFNKVTAGYAEMIALVNLPNGLDTYELVVKVDGVEAIGPGVVLPMFLSYDLLPLRIAPPNTGAGGGHLYVGGYAVQTLGVLMAGLLFGSMAFFIFFVAAARRRRREAESTRSNMVFGKAMRRELSSKAIDKSGVIATQKSRVKRRRK